MTKYVRVVNGRAVDIVDTAIYEPRPSWGQTDEALLDRIYENHKAEWLSANQWFQPCDDALLDGAAVTVDEEGIIVGFTNPIENGHARFTAADTTAGIIDSGDTEDANENPGNGS